MKNNKQVLLKRSFTLKKMAEPSAVVLRTSVDNEQHQTNEIGIKERKERQMRRWTADLDDLRAK